MPLAASVAQAAEPLGLRPLLGPRRERLEREVTACWLGAVVLQEEGGSSAEMLSFPLPFACVWTQSLPAVLHEPQVQVVW